MREVILLGVLIFSILVAIQNPIVITLQVLFLKLNLQKGFMALLFLIIGYVLGLVSKRSKR